MNDNPSPDPHEFQTPEQPSLPPVDNTASHGKRLAAVCIDWFIMIVCLTPVVEYLGLMEIVEKKQAIPMELAIKMLAFQYGIFLAINVGFLYSYGQTIGKRFMRIAIVNIDGSRPALLPLILNRYVSQWAMGLFPVLGPFLRLLDWTLIFREDKRCLHDLIAKTRVIDLSIQAPVINSIIV